MEPYDPAGGVNALGASGLHAPLKPRDYLHVDLTQQTKNDERQKKRLSGCWFRTGRGLARNVATRLAGETKRGPNELSSDRDAPGLICRTARVTKHSLFVLDRRTIIS